METFALLVAGSRNFNNYDLLSFVLDKLLFNQQNKKIVIIEGEARGADTLAKKYAEEKGYEVIPFPANWKAYGKRAGYIRNAEMHNALSKYEHRGVVCFWDGKSKGTAHNFRLAYKYNNPIRVIKNGIYMHQKELDELTKCMISKELELMERYDNHKWD